MEVISSELRVLLEQESDEIFCDELIIQELLLPMFETWTNIMISNEQHSKPTLSKCWSDLHSVLDRLPLIALSRSISRTEYLVDMILQHVQIDMFDIDNKTWEIAAKCLLVFLDNCGSLVWQETKSTADDFFDNLLDIYQSTEVSRSEKHRAVGKPDTQCLSQSTTILELMIAMILKPSWSSTSGSYSCVISGCITDLMSCFKTARQTSKGMDQNTSESVKMLTDVRVQFIDIVESYLTDTTKNCRALLLASAEQSADNLPGNLLGNMTASDDMVYLKNDKAIPTNSLSVLSSTVNLISSHKNILDFPELFCHIMSCHSHLCVIPEVRKKSFPHIMQCVI